MDRRYVSFMYSYPNLIPLGERSIRQILDRVAAVPVRADLRRLERADRAGGRRGRAGAVGRAVPALHPGVASSRAVLHSHSQLATPTRCPSLTRLRGVCRLPTRSARCRMHARLFAIAAQTRFHGGSTVASGRSTTRGGTGMMDVARVGGPRRLTRQGAPGQQPRGRGRARAGGVRAGRPGPEQAGRASQAAASRPKPAEAAKPAAPAAQQAPAQGRRRSCRPRRAWPSRPSSRSARWWSTARPARRRRTRSGRRDPDGPERDGRPLRPAPGLERADPPPVQQAAPARPGRRVQDARSPIWRRRSRSRRTTRSTRSSCARASSSTTARRSPSADVVASLKRQVEPPSGRHPDLQGRSWGRSRRSTRSTR